MALPLQIPFDHMPKIKTFKMFSRVTLVSYALVGAMAGLAIGCGDDNDDQVNDPNASTGLGNFTLECGGESGSQQQQKQVPFQLQQQQSCGKQQFQFKKATVDDFSVKLDCSSNTVTVTAKGNGQQQQQQSLSIQRDGTVKGKFTYPQQMQSDGKGHTVCWIQYDVNFDGKAQCDAQQSAASEDDKLSLKTQVDLKAVSNEELQQAGINGGPTPSPSASASPSPSVSPSMSPSPSPSPSPSASASPSPSLSPSPSPSTSPSPSASPVVICIVEDPCPVVGSTDLSCPDDGTDDGGSY
jgi:hypothetical protein